LLVTADEEEIVTVLSVVPELPSGAEAATETERVCAKVGVEKPARAASRRTGSAARSRPERAAEDAVSSEEEAGRRGSALQPEEAEDSGREEGHSSHARALMAEAWTQGERPATGDRRPAIIVAE